MAIDLAKLKRKSKILMSTIKAGDVLLVLAVLVLTIFVTLSVGNKTYDDAYITFRYARNLARGMFLSTILARISWERPLHY